MSHTGDLVRGVLQLLDTAGVGRYRPKTDPGPPWGDDEVALAANDLPAAPDRAVAVHAYDVSADSKLSESIKGLQVSMRGTRAWDDVEAIGDAVFDALQGLANHQLATGVYLELVTFQSGVPGGLDGNDRWEQVHNYYARTFRPSTHRT